MPPNATQKGNISRNKTKKWYEKLDYQVANAEQAKFCFCWTIISRKPTTTPKPSITKNGDSSLRKSFNQKNMKITTKLLQSLNACQECIDLVASYDDKEAEAVVSQLIEDEHWNYVSWLLPRLMSYKGYVSYAVFAAELMLPIWEKEYPDDARPRQAIEAAKRCIDDPSEENKEEAAKWAAGKAAKATVRTAKEAAWAAKAAWVAAWAAKAAVRAGERVVANPDTKPQLIEKGLELLNQYPNA